jgi:palmitoyltransferase ZDHHC2/15/20
MPTQVTEASLDAIEVASSWQAPDVSFPPQPCSVAPCSCFRCLASPMFVVVFGLVGVSYAPFVLWTTHSTAWSYFSLGVFHVLVALLLSSYVMCLATDPGTTPAAWHDQIAANSRLAAQHRLCPRTRTYRPLRSHYCSVTRRVVLNMDHFCPWVVNTVGFYNRKFFLLFLLYTFSACTWVLINSQPLIGALYAGRGFPGPGRWSSTRMMVASMSMLLDASLAIMLLFFGGFHFRMALINETSIEGHSPAFDIDSRTNWEQVFGTNPWLWFLPVWGNGPAGDGVHWPTHHRHKESCEAAHVEEGHLLPDTSASSDASTDA